MKFGFASAVAAAALYGVAAHEDVAGVLSFSSDELHHISSYAAQVAKALTTTISMPMTPVGTVPQHIMPSAECMQCVCGASKGALEISLRMVNAVCAHRVDDGKKGPWYYLCRWAEKSQEETAGFLAAKLHPMLTGYAYCMGKGVCHAHASPEMLTGLGAHHCTVEGETLQEMLPAGDMGHVHANLQSVMEAMQHSHHHDDTTPSKDCHHCLKITMRHVVHMAERKARHACEEHKDCPIARRVCEFMEKHPKFARGYIVGMVEPWKFAMGYCLGRHLCHYGENDSNQMPPSHDFRPHGPPSHDFRPHGPPHRPPFHPEFPAHPEQPPVVEPMSVDQHIIAEVKAVIVGEAVQADANPLADAFIMQ